MVVAEVELEDYSTGKGSKDDKDKNEDSGREQKGLNFWQTAFFITGEVAGSGLLALPNAVLGTGYIGVVLIVVFCVMAGYAGCRLGSCWTILENRYEEYRTGNRQPYQCIGLVCYGKWMWWFVTACVYFTLMGGSVVYVLLIAGMVQELFQYSWNVSICYWSLIVAGVMIPLSWLGTPKDFWPMAICASFTVALASLLITIQALLDIGVYEYVYYPTPSFKSFSLSFGAILFAFGGASTFPTIQNDMKDRSHFGKAAIIGFIGILIIYMPAACAGYFVFGQYVNANIALTISDGPLRITSQILLIIHLFCAYMVVINPCFQDLEQYLKINPEFSVKRCAFRTVVVLFILFIGETVPEFSKIQDLVGGSGITALTFICPAIFYIRLCGMEGPTWEKTKIPLYELAFLWEIIIIGLLGGIASTVSAVWELAVPNALSMPCYVQLTPPL